MEGGCDRDNYVEIIYSLLLAGIAALCWASPTPQSQRAGQLPWSSFVSTFLLDTDNLSRRSCGSWDLSDCPQRAATNLLFPKSLETDAGSRRKACWCGGGRSVWVGNGHHRLPSDPSESAANPDDFLCSFLLHFLPGLFQILARTPKAGPSEKQHPRVLGV